MDNSVLIAIAIVGIGATFACAGAFLVLTAPDDEPPDEGELGAEAYIHSSHRVVFLPADDPAPGLAAKQGRRALFHSDEGEAGIAAPAAVLGHRRGRFRFVK